MSETRKKNILSVKEVSKLLGYHIQTIYDMCSNGQIPHLKIGKSQRSIRFDSSDVNEWLEERKQQVSKNIVLEPIEVSSFREYDRLFLRRFPMSKKKGSGHWNYGYGGILERRTKSGLTRFDIWWYDQNRKIQQQVVKQAFSRKEAMVALEFKRQEIFRRLYTKEADRETIKFKDYCERFLKEITLRRLKSRDNIELVVRKRLLPFFGDMALDRVNPGKVKDYILKRKSEKCKFRDSTISNSSLNVELSHLRRIFNMAIEEEQYAIEKNPVKSSLFLKDDTKKRDKVLSAKEEERLLAVVATHIRPMIITALNTGMRKLEISTLTWENVDLKNRTITVTAEHSKNGKPREIPINSVLLNELKVLKADNGSSEFVFTFQKKVGDIRPIGDFKIAWMAALKRAGIDGFTFHGLRHTFASRLAGAGIHPFEAGKILGHSSIDMTRWYSHSTMDQLLKAVEKVNGNGKSSGVFEESQARD